MFLFSAFLLGFMGSIHCLGMCGPLVAAMPITGKTFATTIGNATIYHGTRISAYGMLGIIPGIIGEGIQFTGLQQWVSLFVGLFFIGIFVVLIINKHAFHWGAWDRWSTYIQNLIQPWLNSSGLGRVMALGLFNGLIPCGMTYMAMASALTATNVLNGVGFMMVFGLGTAPALILISVLKYYNRSFWKKELQFLIPFGYLIVGTLLIYRGMLIDVPLDLRVLKIMGWDALCH